MDDINFAAQCLLEMSHSKDHLNRPLDLSISHELRFFNIPGPAVIVEPIPVVPPTYVKEEPVTTNSAESSSYMVARILTDLTRIKQEPVPEVPSDSEGNLTIDEEPDEGYNSPHNSSISSPAVVTVHNKPGNVIGNNNNNDNSDEKCNKNAIKTVDSGESKSRKVDVVPVPLRKTALPRTPTSTRIASQMRKTHKCSYEGCHKVYGKSSHLKAHLRTHTEVSHSNRHLDMTISHDLRFFNIPGPAVIVEPILVVPPTYVKEEPVTTNSAESSSYMVARILTDLTRIKQEPVPEVPSDSKGNFTIDEEPDEGYNCPYTSSVSSPAVMTVYNKPGNVVVNNNNSPIRVNKKQKGRCGTFAEDEH